MSTTLLSIVQSILSDIDGDEVNSIADTVEATQVANTVKSIHDEIFTEYDLQAGKQLFQLEASGDTSIPTHMRVPEQFHSVEWLNYDTRQDVDLAAQYTPMQYVFPENFIQIVNGRNSTDSGVLEVEDPDNGVKLFIRTDAAPSIYTMFNDRTVVFDAYNVEVDDTLQQSKTQVFGQKLPTLVIDDATVIELPPHLITMLTNEVRAFTFDVYKDGAPNRVEKRATRSRIRAQRIRHSMRENRKHFEGPDYGRK
jgi:hypothetical protein